MSEHPATSVPEVLLLGHCDPILGAALAFKLLPWKVRVSCDPLHLGLVQGRLSVLKHENEIEIEAMLNGPAGMGKATADVVVYCREHGSPTVFVPTGPEGISIELCGVKFDDGEDHWTSCSDLISYMRSGVGILTRERDDDGLRGLPYLAAGGLASFFLGCHVALLANAALEARVRPRKIQVTAQECLLAILHTDSLFAQLENRDTARMLDPRPPGGRYVCREGELRISLVRANQWEKLVDFLGNPDWAQGGWWRDPVARFVNRDLFDKAISAWCTQRTALDAFVALQDAGIPAAYTASVEDVITNQQLVGRGFVANLEAGPSFVGRPYRVLQAERKTGRTRPAPAAHRRAGDRMSVTGNRASLPLSGLRICDFSAAWAGPYLTMHAATLGASVVKVESRTRLDTHRTHDPLIPSDDPPYERAAGHLLTDRGKLSITVDLKHPSGRGVVEDVIAGSDALVVNFAPGVMDRLGLGFPDVADLVGNRGFVYVSLSGFGSTGPWGSYRSYGHTLAELSGLTALTGEEGAGVIPIALPFADPLCGTFGAAALLSYLRVSRERESPIFLDVSQFEVLVSGIADAIACGQRMGNVREADLPGSGVYECIESKTWIAVSVTRQEQMDELARIVGGHDLNGERIEVLLSTWAAARRARDVANTLRAAGIDCTEVLSVAELVNDRSLRATKYWVQTAIPNQDFMMQDAPWLSDGMRLGANAIAPRLGEHTELVLRAVLGYSDSRIDELIQSGALN